jgi:hypothetical protein
MRVILDNNESTQEIHKNFELSDIFMYFQIGLTLDYFIYF